jgi:uroporphyrinogen-III synthase
MKVFISRTLAADSVFRTHLTQAGFEVFGESLVRFSDVPFVVAPDADWIFFYSKTAVSFFFKNVDFSFFKQKKIAAIGAATAFFLKEKYGIAAEFIGTGEPTTTAAAFEKEAQGKKVLFPRAETSQQSVQLLLSDKIEVSDIVVYRNEMRRDFERVEADILVFTSPLNARAFVARQVDFLPHQTVVAIGTTTQKALLSLGFKNITLAQTPTEAALAEAVLSSAVRPKIS